MTTHMTPMKIAAAGLLAAVLLPVGAQAQPYGPDRGRYDRDYGYDRPNPNTYDMTCAQTRRLVRERGSVVLDIGSRRYGRFVRSEGFCPRTFVDRPAWVPTADRRNCFIGYRCQPKTQQ